MKNQVDEDKIRLSNPHDKYVRYSLQIQEIAFAFFRFALHDALFNNIDWGSLKISQESFIDEDLQSRFLDICYYGNMINKIPIRISLLVEHKSTPPANGELTIQIGQYKLNIQRADLLNKKKPSITIAIVLYHGKNPIPKETSENLYEFVPEYLKPHIYLTDYILVDLSQKTEQELVSLHFQKLKIFLVALKYSREEAKHLFFINFFFNFVSQLVSAYSELEFYKTTFNYMSTVSQSFTQNLEIMGSGQQKETEAEYSAFDYFLDKWKKLAAEKGVQEGYEQGLEKGIEQGLEKGIEQGLKKGIEQGLKKGIEQGIIIGIRVMIITNPELTDENIGALFQVDTSLVQKIRNKEI